MPGHPDLDIANEYTDFLRRVDDKSGGGFGAGRSAVVRERGASDANAGINVESNKEAIQQIDAHGGIYDPHAEQAIAWICRGIESAAKALNFDVGDGFVSAVLPGYGHQASSTRLPGTSVGIVAVDRSFVPFTGHLGRLVAWRINVKTDAEGSLNGAERSSFDQRFQRRPSALFARCCHRVLVNWRPRNRQGVVFLQCSELLES